MADALTCALGEPWMGPHPLCEAESERACRQFDADVAAGKYDQDGYTPAERRAQQKRGETMTPTAVAESEAFRALDERYMRIPIEQIVPSKTNPRTHFDETYIAQLSVSVAEKGVIEPLLVRQVDAGSHKPNKFEIVAGECRYRAARKAGLTHLPSLVRLLSDEQALEHQLIENLHRRDLMPLEEAAGFRALIKSNPDKHSAASIAERIGKSPSWVWDLMKLLDLIPEAKGLLEQGKMAVGHGILIARQKPEDQKRIIDPNADALFVPLEHGLEFDGVGDPQEKPGKYDDVKAVTVRELEAWVARHIRFDVAHAAKAVPLQFEQTAARVEEAAAAPGRGKKVIAITFDNWLADDAKDPSERTYGEKSWKRADGTKKSQLSGGWPRRLVDSPTCEYSVLGVVAVGGEHYGETFEVCINRDKCKTHWGKEIAEREKNAKLRESGQGKKAKRSEAAAEAREQKAAAERARRDQRWKVFAPALGKAVHAAAAKVPATLPKPLFEKVVEFHRLPKGTTPAQLAKALLEHALKTTFDRYNWSQDEPRMVAWAKLLGVDVKACEPKAETAQSAGVDKGKAGKKRTAA